MSYKIDLVDSKTIVSSDVGNYENNKILMLDTDMGVAFTYDFTGIAYVDVFTIDNSLNITVETTTTIYDDDKYNGFFDVEKIDSTHFAFIFGSLNYDTFVKIFTVNTQTYAITTTSTLDIANKNGGLSYITKLPGANTMVALFRDEDIEIINTYNKLVIISYNDTTYSMSNEYSDILSTSSDYYTISKPVGIDSSSFVLGYDPDGLGFNLYTITIDESYVPTTEDTLSVDNVNYRGLRYAYDSSAELLMGINTEETTDDGYIRSLSINNSYELSELDSDEHDTSFANYNSINYLDSYLYIVAYRSTSVGKIKLFSVTSGGVITQVSTLDISSTSSPLYIDSAIIDTESMVAIHRDGSSAIKITTYSITETTATSEFLMFF